MVPARLLFDPDTGHLLVDLEEQSGVPDPAGVPAGRALATAAGGLDYRKALFNRRELSGLEPERLDATTLYILPGYCSDGSAAPTDYMEVSKTLSVDLTTTGLNGLDVGTLIDGISYHVWITKNPTTGEVGAVVSDQVSTGAVTFPDGFTLYRKLPWGFVAMGGGLPAHHLSGWPLPHTQFTDASDSPEWAAVVDGVSTANEAFSVTPWVPDNARMVDLLCKVEGHTGAGSGRLRIMGSGFPVGHVSDVGDVSYSFARIRVTSARTAWYRVTGGARMSVFVMGYSQNERS